MITVARVVEELERIAPPWLAEEGDAIGLQIGGMENEVHRVRVCVDASPRVVDMALEQQADLIVSHHPLIYTPLKSVVSGDPVAQTVASLIRAEASLCVMHTNYDSAPGGVNDVLASELGLTESVLMTPRKQTLLYKIAVFVPEEALESVRDAMSAAGAGVIGDYTHCSFRTAGTGTFLPTDEARPHVGTVGRLEETSEYRLEMLVSDTARDSVIAAMLAVHPYEEVAYDVYHLANEPERFGFGRVGALESPVSLADFAVTVRSKLQPAAMKVTGDAAKLIRRVAVGAGGCSGLFSDAVALGADVYVTGDTKHHDVLAAESLGMAVIDAGHFETEQPGMVMLADRLAAAFSGHEIEVSYV